jgi:lysophospholipase L1-like esterase
LLVALNVALIFVNKRLQQHPPPLLPPTLPAGQHLLTPSPLPTPENPDEGRPLPGKKRDPDTISDLDMRAYAGLPRDRVETMIDDMNDFGHAGSVFLPWVEFGPPTFKSATVNIITDGPEFPYRISVLDPAIKVDPSWPTVKVFMLGGSTTFGSRVADEWTLASAMWNVLQRQGSAAPHPYRVELTNWGRTWYYSSQELALLRRLLRTGHKPDVVVFLDGLNDVNNWCTVGSDQPVFSGKLAEIYRYNQMGKDWLAQYGWIPMVRFAFLVRSHITPPPAPPADLLTEEQVAARAQEIVDTYQENVSDARRLCNENGIKSYFFWQPVPFVKYDLSLHRATPTVSPGIVRAFQEVYAKIPSSVPEAVDLDDALQQYGHKHVFVDMVHYSPDFHKFLAGLMAQHMALP